MLKPKSTTIDSPGRAADGSSHAEASSAADRRRRAMAPTVFCPERDVVQCVSRLTHQEHPR